MSGIKLKTMTYKLKEKPELVYWLETKQFTLIDEDGNEYEIRVGESNKNTEASLWNEPGGWDDLNNDDIWDYINDSLADDEYEFEMEEIKERNKKMELRIQEYIKENGEIKDIKQIDDVIYNLSVEVNEGKYGERMYEAYKFVRDFLKKQINE